MSAAVSVSASPRTFAPPALRSPAREPSAFAPDAEWAAWHRRRRESLPGWHFDAGYLTSHALERLPAACAALGCGEAVAILPRPRWWFPTSVSHREAALHGLRSTNAKPVIAVRLTPDSFGLLFIDQATGAWDVPNVGRCGAELVSLAAWRWNITSVKAAWRLARLCGLGRPAL